MRAVAFVLTCLPHCRRAFRVDVERRHRAHDTFATEGSPHQLELLASTLLGFEASPAAWSITPPTSIRPARHTGALARQVDSLIDRPSTFDAGDDERIFRRSADPDMQVTPTSSDHHECLGSRKSAETSDVPELPRHPDAPANDPMTTTLGLLEWKRFSKMVASQADTGFVRASMSRGLPVHHSRQHAEKLQRLMEEAYTILFEWRRNIQLNRFADIAPLVTFAQKDGVLTGGQLYAIQTSLVTARTLVKALKPGGEEDEEPKSKKKSSVTELPALFDGLPVQAALQEAIAGAIDAEGEVKDDGRPDLYEVRTEYRDLQLSVREQLKQLCKSKKEFLAIPQPVARDDGKFCLAVKANFKHMVPGTTRDISPTGATVYIEPKGIEGTNTRLRQLKKKDEQICLAIRKALSEKIADPKVSEELAQLQEAVTIVDSAAARARYSNRLQGRKIVFGEPNTKNGLNLDALMHPLLVWRDRKSDPNPEQMVPMDVAVPNGVRSVVITGPNTGGKTIMLKTLGYAALMAKAGLRVLSSDALGGNATSEEKPEKRKKRKKGNELVVPFFDAVMADIGDDQSIAQSLSTFSAHVGRLQRILDAVTAKPNTTLVLLDEVGSGTDPTEGAALGMAILRELAKYAALTVSTTHHSRLKSLKFAPETRGLFENACVEFDVASMAPTYNVLWGIPGKSNAVAIAKRLGLRETVVSDARELMAEETDASVEDVLASLTAQREEQRLMNLEIQKLRDDTEKEKRALKEEKKQFMDGMDAEREKRRQEFEQEFTQAQSALREALAEAKAAKNSSKVSKKIEDGVKKKLAGATVMSESQYKHATKEVSKKTTKKIENAKPGDWVLIPSIGDGTYVVDSVKGKHIFIEYGDFGKMKLPLKDVSKVISKARARR